MSAGLGPGLHNATRNYGFTWARGLISSTSGSPCLRLSEDLQTPEAGTPWAGLSVSTLGDSDEFSKAMAHWYAIIHGINYAQKMRSSGE